MRLKGGVRLHGLKPEALFAMLVANEVFASMGKDFTVTSVIEGTHSPGSLHYVGQAFDCRTMHCTQEEIVTIQRELASRLGDDYDVVLESSHCHVEFQPKRAYGP